MAEKEENYDNYWAEEVTDDPAEEEKMKKEMKEFLSSIYFDAEIPDWKQGDTWGDPDDEYVPTYAKKYRVNKSEMVNPLHTKSKPTTDSKFQGFSIKIETPAGGIRSGTDSNGKPWQTRMIYDYGYIKRTEGLDGDHVDVYVGPDETADYVYIMHQVKPATGEYDEDKCMLGFGSEESARWSYLRHYTDSRFLGAVTALPISLFKDRLFNHKGEPIIPDAASKVKAAKDAGQWPIFDPVDDGMVVKYGTRDGAMKRWRLQKMGLEHQLEEASANRDATQMIKIRRKMASGERIYKSIVAIHELVKDVK